MTVSLDILENVRIERKKVLNVGLIFVFATSLIMFIFNAYNLIRNINLLYMNLNPLLNGLDINDLQSQLVSDELHTLKFKEELQHENLDNKKYPNSVVLITISQLNTLSMNTLAIII